MARVVSSGRQRRLTNQTGANKAHNASGTNQRSQEFTKDLCSGNSKGAVLRAQQATIKQICSRRLRRSQPSSSANLRFRFAPSGVTAKAPDGAPSDVRPDRCRRAGDEKQSEPVAPAIASPETPAARVPAGR